MRELQHTRATLGARTPPAGATTGGGSHAELGIAGGGNSSVVHSCSVPARSKPPGRLATGGRPELSPRGGRSFNEPILLSESRVTPEAGPRVPSRVTFLLLLTLVGSTVPFISCPLALQLGVLFRDENM